MSEWISVKDKLPEWDTDCLIAYKNDLFPNFRVCETHYGGVHTNGFGIWGVSHWMPLPEPPKEE